MNSNVAARRQPAPGRYEHQTLLGERARLGRRSCVGERAGDRLHVLIRPDLERAERIGEFWSYPQSQIFPAEHLWGGQDLNLRPTDYESAALTD